MPVNLPVSGCASYVVFAHFCDSRARTSVAGQTADYPNPVVTAPIIGPRTGGQLDSSLRALEIELADDTLTKLDEIWPGPGGTAPEAYAW